jgi:hypothetical protein
LTTEERLAAEAVRVYRRYAVEIVEALGFCPYAERSRLEGRTREVVLTAPIPTDREVLGAIEAIAEDTSIEVGLVLFPRLTIGRTSHGRWVEHLRKAHASYRGAAVLAIEGFHPDAEADMSSAERLTPFVRRTPDPTLQLTRLSVLDRVRRGTPQGTAFFDPSTMNLRELLETAEPRALHVRIAERNLETVRRLGAGEVANRIVSILRDRDASYAAIDPDVPRRLTGT